MFARHKKGHLDYLGDNSGGCGQKVETEQEKKEAADHISQDHCKQDLFHDQPADEGRIQNWGNFQLALLLQVENPLNRLVILAKYGSMMLAGDCHFIQVPCQYKISSKFEQDEISRLSTTLGLVTPTGSTGSLASTKFRTEPGTGSLGWQHSETM